MEDSRTPLVEFDADYRIASTHFTYGHLAFSVRIHPDIPGTLFFRGVHYIKSRSVIRKSRLYMCGKGELDAFLDRHFEWGNSPKGQLYALVGVAETHFVYADSYLFVK